jgi:hypothetical protein
MTHLTRDELDAFWRGDATAERERIVGHLAACDACGALYGEVVDADLPPPSTVPRRLLERGRRVYRGGGRRATRGRWRLVVPLAALAAAAVVAVVLLEPRRPTAPPAAERAPGVRGTAVVTLAPRGEGATLDFRWSSAVRPASFAVEVREPDGAAVLRRVVPGESWEPSPAERAAIVPGRAYEWRVVALDAAGEALTASSWQRFSVAPGG